MTILFSRNYQRSIGIFHDFGEEIATGYISVHLVFWRLELLWSK